MRESFKTTTGEVTKAAFVERPNRFVVVCERVEKGKKQRVKAFLPNPGRLWELLFPGSVLYLEKSANAGRKLSHTVVAVERDGVPVLLNTHGANRVARHLVERGLVPGLAGWKVKKSEYTLGRSRFDFLLERDGREMVLEVKSCTLYGARVAMFPDAVTERGRRHVKELTRLEDGREGVVLFVVYYPGAKYFMPDHHTDLAFARTLLAAREKVRVLPVAVSVNPDLSVEPAARPVEIPWKLIEGEAVDGGSYMMIMRLPRARVIEAGGLGRVRLERGFYIYVGSARRNLTARVARHKRKRKRMRWHVDYLRDVCDVSAALPVRTRDDIECELAGAVAGLYPAPVPGFGSSDCRCASHLFHSREDPLDSPAFHEVLRHYRMERYFSDDGG